MAVDELRRCDCGAYPVPVAMPYHERLVALECPRCGISTGYCVSAEQATASWNAGNVASYANPLFDIDDEPVQLTLSEEAVDFARALRDMGVGDAK